MVHMMIIAIYFILNLFLFDSVLQVATEDRSKAVQIKLKMQNSFCACYCYAIVMHESDRNL